MLRAVLVVLLASFASSAPAQDPTRVCYLDGKAFSPGAVICNPYYSSKEGFQMQCVGSVKRSEPPGPKNPAYWESKFDIQCPVPPGKRQ
jgi:hypothetical protein